MDQALATGAVAPAPRDVSHDFAHDLLEGLRSHPKRVPCKYFYDARGSALFDQICALPEYYQTRTEIGLLERHAEEMAALMGPGVELVEFGAGSLRKARILLGALRQPFSYMPIDISGEYLQSVVVEFAGDYPDLLIRPVIGDFTDLAALPPRAPHRRRVGFFPGSTIGNLDEAEAVRFLKRAAAMLTGGGFLVGVDLVKDPQLLHAAYNDGSGVTAEFNKNILVRANCELGADFELDKFAHYAFYHPVAQRIEMYLVSLARQRVRLAGQSICLAQGETIHTENSYKYSIERFRALAAGAGFVPRAVWTDHERLFSIHWLETA